MGQLSDSREHGIYIYAEMEMAHIDICLVFSRLFNIVLDWKYETRGSPKTTDVFTFLYEVPE